VVGGRFKSAGGLASNGYADHSPGKYSAGSAFATDKRVPAGFAPIAIGLALTLIHLIGIPVTNTSVNPARSTGPAVFVGGWALAGVACRWLGDEKSG
jgi:aquaporin Z